MSSQRGTKEPLNEWPDTVITAQMIEKLPRTMTSLPLFALVAGDVDQSWEVSITLAPSDQAVLDALRPVHMQLCMAAQHALGLAGIGSLIEPALGTVRVRMTKETALRLAGLEPFELVS